MFSEGPPVGTIISVRTSSGVSLRERFQSPYITCSFSISKFEDEEVGFVTRRITMNASSNIPVLESTNQFKPHTPQASSALPQRYCHPTDATPAPLNIDRRIEAHGRLDLQWWGIGRAHDGSVLVCRVGTETVARGSAHGQVGTVCDVYQKVRIDFRRRHGLHALRSSSSNYSCASSTDEKT